MSYCVPSSYSLHLQFSCAFLMHAAVRPKRFPYQCSLVRSQVLSVFLFFFVLLCASLVVPYFIPVRVPCEQRAFSFAFLIMFRPLLRSLCAPLRIFICVQFLFPFVFYSRSFSLSPIAFFTAFPSELAFVLLLVCRTSFK